jgi:hypothetical protein
MDAELPIQKQLEVACGCKFASNLRDILDDASLLTDWSTLKIVGAKILKKANPVDCLSVYSLRDDCTEK